MGLMQSTHLGGEIQQSLGSVYKQFPLSHLCPGMFQGPGSERGRTGCPVGPRVQAVQVEWPCLDMEQGSRNEGGLAGDAGHEGCTVGGRVVGVV